MQTGPCCLEASGGGRGGVLQVSLHILFLPLSCPTWVPWIKTEMVVRGGGKLASLPGPASRKRTAPSGLGVILKREREVETGQENSHKKKLVGSLMFLVTWLGLAESV